MAFFGMGDEAGVDTIAKKKLSALESQEKQDAIVPPDIRDSVKAAKIKDPEMEMAQSLIAKGISPLTDPTKFLQAFGATAEQAGISRTWGPLDRIREIVSPDYQNLKARQHGLLQLGSVIHGEMAKQFVNRMNAPKTLQEAQQLVPGVVPPVESQRMGAPLGPRDQGPIAPFDPQAELIPAQQNLALNALQNISEGKLMQTGEGIVPTSFATVQGRMIQPEAFQFAQEAISAPPGAPIRPPSTALPNPLVNKILEERGQAQRQTLKGPDFNNRLESLAAVESVKRFGQPMNFMQVAQTDPAFAGQLRQQAEIQESKDIFSFQQGEMMKRAIAQTGPVTEEKAAAERRQPVGGEISKYGRISADGMSIDKPSSTKLNQDQLNAQGFVDLSRFKNEVDGVNDLNIIEKDFNKLKRYSDELFTAGVGLGSILRQKGRLTVARLTNSGQPTRIVNEKTGRPMTVGELANTYAREVESMLEYYGRNLKGLRGAATEGDVERMRQNFASDWTSKAVKDQLMSDTSRLIGNIRQGAMTTMFGAAAAKEQAKQAGGDDEQQLRAQIRELLRQNKSAAEIKSILGRK